VNKGGPPRVLAIASAGGHWIQLRRLQPAFEGTSVLWVTTNAGYRTEMGAGERFAAVPDANRWNKVGLAWSAFRILLVILRHRPRVVVTTGAAPGYFAIRFAKVLGARTLWVDSIANADELSLSGQLAMKTADEVLTQWPHVAQGERPAYRGSIL
jgi:UDP-N-acetylglucosamine:LPS N-acetylglucosamine transferase